ncbi:phage protein NinX family protein [Proteus sp. LHD240705]|uniref:phage protein NinX family protein n=1 Tax=Proteus sp. LHD240705 TaxID=3400183 RepID=UPI003A4DF205
MNKYTELSDFEINKKVADLIGATPFPFGSTDYRRSAVSGCESAIIIRSPRKVGSFDPCNNPPDAMPIIIENLISLMADMSDGRESTWWCASDISNSFTSNYKSNPLRAAMEVFLMIKDAENEKI